MKSPNSRNANAIVADTDVARLLTAVVPGQEISYQEHRRAAECRDAMARWPLLSDLADALADASADIGKQLHS